MPPDVCVVVPTIRNPACVRDYVANARTHGFDTDRLRVLLITEDHCDVEGMAAMLEELDVDGAVFDEAGRSAWFAAHGLDEYADLIPAASHAQTSFGLLNCWENGEPVCVFIDDDTRPHDDVDFFGTHLRALGGGRTIDELSSDTRWLNVLHQNVDEHGLYPRGFPYSAMGETLTGGSTRTGDVVVSQGLWTEVPDLDAVRILQDGDLDGQAETRLTAADYGEPFVAAPGTYLTVCSMNLAVRREVIPAFYQLPMDDNPWGVGRFDDIWSGVFVKRACDVLGTQIRSGDPLCVHEKAPRSTFEDLAAEAPALAINERLWQIVDDVGGDETTYAGVYRAMADRLVEGEWPTLRNGELLPYLGESMHRWLDCLEAIDRRVGAAVAADD